MAAPARAEEESPEAIVRSVRAQLCAAASAVAAGNGKGRPTAAALDRLSLTFRRIVSACEADIGGGSVSFASSAPRPPSFAALHGVLGDRSAVAALLYLIGSGGGEAAEAAEEAEEGGATEGYWLAHCRKVAVAEAAQVAADSECSKKEEDGAANESVAPSAAAFEWAAANMRFGKSVSLFISDGIIALQGSRPFQSAFAAPSAAADDGNGPPKYAPPTLTPRAAIGVLCEAIGSAGHPFVPFIGQVLRVLAKLRPFLLAAFDWDPLPPLSPPPSPRAAATEGEGEEGSPINDVLSAALASYMAMYGVDPKKPAPPKGTAVAALLAAAAVTSDACAVHEAWSCLRSLLFAHKATTSSYLSHNEGLADFAAGVVAALRPPLLAGAVLAETMGVGAGSLPANGNDRPVAGSWYVNCRQGLKLLALLLGDPSLGKGRTRLADCPALLAASLGVVGFLQQRRLAAVPAAAMAERPPLAEAMRPDGFAHDALLIHEAYHVLKVYIAKPKKALSVRFLLTANRDAIIHFVLDYHTIAHEAAAAEAEEGNANGGGEGGSDDDGYDDDEVVAREAERKLLMGALTSTEPLDADEIYTLRHYLDVSITASEHL